MRILVAGATGELGRQVVQALKAEGHWVRVLSRSRERAIALDADALSIADATQPAHLAGVCTGIERIFSCLGQSVGTDMAQRGPGYRAIDYVANRNLIEAAKQSGVGRMVYVSVFGAEHYPHVAYFRAHNDVADELRRSGLHYAIIQPTGFFSAYKAFFEMAKAGRAVVFGDGSARTNPIHDADLAQVCVTALLSDTNADIPVGGPTVHTRREVVELAFQILGKPVRIITAPTWVPGLVGSLAQPFAPRIGELMKFLGVVSTGDFIAPIHGERTLESYYRELVG